MKLLLIFILVFSFLKNPNCQSDTSNVEFVSYWAIGDTYNFRVTKIKEQWKDGVLSKQDSSQYLAKFEVIDSTTKSYTIKWSFKKNLQKFNIPTKMLSRFSKYSMTEVVYKTTELGEFIGIENWEEIRDMMIGLWDEVINLIVEESGKKEKEVRKSIEPLTAIFNTKQGIEMYVFQELQFFHFPFGIACPVSKPIEYEDQLPNMFGGKPIRGDARLFIEKVNFELHKCVLINQMQLNSEDTKKMLQQVFSKMKLKENDLKKAMKKAKLDIIDNNRFEFFYYPGVPIKIERERVSIMDIAAEKGKRIDKIIIELIE